MSKGLGFSSGKSYEQEQGLPMYPDTCGVPGCHNETNFVMIKVSSGAGIQHKVASDVLTRTTQPFTLKDGYNYIGWFTRCGKCLQDGIRNKQAIQKVNDSR